MHNLWDHIIFLNHDLYTSFQFSLLQLLSRSYFNQFKIKWVSKRHFLLLLNKHSRFWFSIFKSPFQPIFNGVALLFIEIKKMYIWFSSGCHGEPHSGSEPLIGELRYMLATHTISTSQEGGGNPARRLFISLIILTRLAINFIAWNITAEKPQKNKR